MNKKRDPLKKRILRELKSEKSKYIPIFIFFVILVGLVSGMQISSSSMEKAYDEGIEKYNLEDGHFTLSSPYDTADIEKINEKLDEKVEINEQFFYNCSVTNPFSGADDGKEYSFRIYKNRDVVNTASIFEGHLPEKSGEIAIDRLYAQNNNLELGDTITLYDMEYEICAFVAVPDFSALYENNTDLMFNASSFTFAFLCDEDFEKMPDAKLNYSYTWIFTNPDISDKEAYNASDDVLNALIGEQFPITDFLKRQDSRAITFAKEDISKDSGIVVIFLYIMTILLGFIYAVIINNTIEKEAAVIGTLRATGYTKGELIRHYMTAPVAVTFAAAIVGNVLGYTVFNTMMANLYYQSYSLVKYKTLFNVNAFLLTTVIPLIILIAINYLSIATKLSLSPLKFLRRDLSKHKKSHVVKLPGFKFINRFRLRVLIQNIPSYLTMMLGIIIANVLFMFCAFMLPWLEHFSDKVIDSSLGSYQYILKEPYEIDDENAMIFSTDSFLVNDDDEISVFGIAENTPYYSGKNIPVSDDEIIVSEGCLKYLKLDIGDEITLYKKYSDETYTFTIVGTHPYEASLAAFMSNDSFNRVFGYEEGHYTGYISDKPLDIDSNYVVTVITPDDMSNISTQLEDSVGGIIEVMKYACIIIYTLIVYLLAKVVLERNANAISLTKILGYNTGEIGKIYIVSTAIAVVLSILISIPVCYLALKLIAAFIVQFFGCWIELYIPTYLYFVLIGFGIASYALVSLLHLRKIGKIPMEEALKNAE